MSSMQTVLEVIRYANKNHIQTEELYDWLVEVLLEDTDLEDAEDCAGEAEDRGIGAMITCLVMHAGITPLSVSERIHYIIEARNGG